MPESSRVGSSTARRTRSVRNRILRTRLRQRRFQFSLRGKLLLIFGLTCLVFAYALGREELVYLGCLVAGLPLIARVFVRFRRQRMSVARQFAPAVAEAGHPVTVTVEVRNLGTDRTGEARWRDELPWGPFRTPAARLRPLGRNRGAFGRDSTASVGYVLDPPRRGVFEIGPLVVEFADPFHLATGEIVVGERQKLVVTPAIVALPITGQSIAADDGSARALQRRANGGDDELMTREYRYGDPLRRVHWRATAHHGELMVRQEEQRSHAQARILLDTRRAGYHDAGHSSSQGSSGQGSSGQSASGQEVESEAFEWALAFSASVAVRLQRIGFTVQVIETGFRQLATPEHSDDFLESLAAIELIAGPPQRNLISLLPDPGRSLGSVFAIVSDAEGHTVERLVAQRAQFDLAVAFVVNPHNEAVLGPLRASGWICLAVRSTDDPSAVWRAAAEIREASLARA